jgi:phage baseplate assembly protein W
MLASSPNPRAFLGVGWGHPFRLTAAGDVATAAYETDVKQAILIILGTNPGDRVMRPQYGAGLRDFVFSPLNSTTIASIQQRVQNALVQWEPRIDVDEVTASSSPDDSNVLLIDISYTVRSTNSQQNLVYPFFMTEGVNS